MQTKRNDPDLKRKPFLIPLDEEERALQHRDRLGVKALRDSFQNSIKHESNNKKSRGNIDIICVQIRVQDVGGLTCLE